MGLQEETVKRKNESELGILDIESARNMQKLKGKPMMGNIIRSGDKLIFYETDKKGRVVVKEEWTP